MRLFSISSLKLTLLLFLVLFFGVIAWHNVEFDAKNWLITIPLMLLAINLLSALLTNKLFRIHPWLLLFHLALLALLFAIAVGQVTRLAGEAEVTNGHDYDSQIVRWQQGVLHNNRLAELKFHLHDFVIHYHPMHGVAERGKTEVDVSWLDEGGIVQRGSFGDNVALEIHGYQLYSTHNKGFAPMFEWQPKQGAPITGSVHLPPWPARELAQTSDLTIPGTSHKVWLHLKFEDEILYGDRDSVFRTPNDAVLVARVGDKRYELEPGQGIAFENGYLKYVYLNTWMGFRVHYDWTLPWLLLISLIAVIGLGMHFWKKFAPTPWLAEEEK